MQCETTPEQGQSATVIGSATLHLGDCLEVLPTLPADSVDSVVCDPPYDLTGKGKGGFMGKEWDATGVAFRPAVWRECLRVLKPGGHLLAFGSSRTYHRLACAIEDAGFEIRDQIMWLYGQGFPKSLDVSKAFDRSEDYKIQSAVRRAAVESVEAVGLKLPGNSRWDWTTGEHAPGNKWWAEFQAWLPELTDEQRERVEGEIVARVQKTAGWFASKDIYNIHAPATETAKQWDGWGTALKPAHEPIVVARKPLAGTVAENVQRYGTGAINIDGCRVPVADDDDIFSKNPHTYGGFGHANAKVFGDGKGSDYLPGDGRWPANVIHDGSDEVMAEFAKYGESSTKRIEKPSMCDEEANTWGGTIQRNRGARGHTDSGTAARFFYCAKASRKERGEGNTHPTVKPTELMKYLCRLVTPPTGTVLDPFMGSGSTGVAAVAEGFRFVGIEREPEYFKIAKARIAAGAEPPDMILPMPRQEPKKEPSRQPDLFSGGAA